MSISCASAEHSTVTVQVPVHFENEDASPGLKRGGVLNIVRHELELNVRRGGNPRRDSQVDLTGL